MKKILCYGDSNTFGFNPSNGKRYGQNIRWSGILKNKLQSFFNVIESGMNNRVGFIESPYGIEYSAKTHFKTILNQHNEIEILILAIGINDLQFQFNINEDIIKTELLNLIKQAKEKAKRIILLSPPQIKDNILNSFFSSMFDKTSIEKSKNLANIYEKIALENNIKFINLNEITAPSEIDGLHYDENGHLKIAQEILKSIL